MRHKLGSFLCFLEEMSERFEQQWEITLDRFPDNLRL